MIDILIREKIDFKWYIIGKGNKIYSSHIFKSKIGDNNIIGPYAHIRENNVINNNTNVNRNVGGFGYIHKSKWTAFFLCLFLGWLGVHRFYVGKIGTGLIWMFTCGFFFFGWVLDLFIILIGGFRDKAGQPLV